MPNVKVAIIGAGSAKFGPSMLIDLLTNVPELGVIALVDTAQRALHGMAIVAEKLARHLGRDVRVEASTDRTQVLDGAHAVLIAAEQDRIWCWKRDWAILHNFGIAHPLAENRGPAGLSHTLRTVPLVLSICRDIERLAPEALVVVLTNPEDRICYAVTKYTKLRHVVGYCDGLWVFKSRRVGELLGIPGERIYVESAGINHAAWITALRDRLTGEDLYPRLVQKARAENWQPLGLHLYETYGLWAHMDDTHYGEYFHYACEFIDCKGYDFEGYERDAAEWRQRIAGVVEGRYDTAELARQAAAAAWRIFGDSPPSHLVKGYCTGEVRYLPNANVVNRGKIPNVPDDMVVEVPGVATPNGVLGVRVGPFPDPITSFLYREGTIQKLSAEAAVEGAREKALTSLMLDPHIRSARQARELLDAFLDAHRAYIPPEAWWSLRYGG